jgi:DNA-binding NarL/FixJ family response regulator
MKTRVYIVDGHSLIRHGLIGLIAGQADMEVCGQASCGVAALPAIMKLVPDVVTVEIWMNGNSGLELIKGIRAFNPKIGILVISMYDEGDYAVRLLKAGARGFLSKHDSLAKIPDAIRRIARRELCGSGEMRSRMHYQAEPAEPTDAASVIDLTDRELEVGNLIGSGLRTSEIAERLHVSVKTIETHRSNIKRKLQLPNASRLTQFWIHWVNRLNRQNGTAPVARQAK